MRRIENRLDAGQTRMETLLDRQNDILQNFAVSTTEDRMRDQQLAELKAAYTELQAQVAEQKQKMAWYAGALAAVGMAGQFILKKLGLA